MRISHFVLGLCLIVVSTATVRAADLTPTTVWMTDFTKAQAEARNLHRPLVVHFHTHWCPPCRLMEQEVLHTAQVLKTLDEGFVAVKVNLDLADELTRGPLVTHQGEVVHEAVKTPLAAANPVS